MVRKIQTTKYEQLNENYFSRGNPLFFKKKEATGSHGA